MESSIENTMATAHISGRVGAHAKGESHHGGHGKKGEHGDDGHGHSHGGGDGHGHGGGAGVIKKKSGLQK